MSQDIDPINERLRGVGVLAGQLNGMKDEDARKRLIEAMDLMLRSVQLVLGEAAKGQEHADSGFRGGPSAADPLF
jgi:hypothetical protein